jgi:hypothetical protein
MAKPSEHAFLLVATVVLGCALSARPSAMTGPAPFVRTAFAVAQELQDAVAEDVSQHEVEASEELAHRLLDRLEAAGDPAEQGLLRTSAGSVVVHHCARPVLRWHWLCHDLD